jgi:hypothetical protein
MAWLAASQVLRRQEDIVGRKADSSMLLVLCRLYWVNDEHGTQAIIKVTLKITPLVPSGHAENYPVRVTRRYITVPQIDLCSARTKTDDLHHS